MSSAAIADGLSKSIFQVIKPGITSQVLTLNGSSVQSTSWGATTTIVRLFATEDMFISMGPNPTALANDPASFFLPGGMVEYFAVRGTEKLAAINASKAGTLYVTEGNV
jgi:hypothetical protein